MRETLKNVSNCTKWSFTINAIGQCKWWWLWQIQELNKSESVLRARAIVAFHLGNFRSPSHHHYISPWDSLPHLWWSCHHWLVPSLAILAILTFSSPSIASISNIVFWSLIPICIVHHRHHHHHEKSNLKVNPANQPPIEIAHLIVWFSISTILTRQRWWADNCLFLMTQF